jgi:hypothetical protein
MQKIITILLFFMLSWHLSAQVNHHIREFIERKNFLKMHETWEKNCLPLPQVTVDSLIDVQCGMDEGK